MLKLPGTFAHFPEGKSDCSQKSGDHARCRSTKKRSQEPPVDIDCNGVFQLRISSLSSKHSARASGWLSRLSDGLLIFALVVISG